MWIIVCHDNRKDSLVIKITRISFEKKKKVNMYKNYSCEHDEHLLYQNKKEKVQIMWIIINRDSKKIVLSLKSLELVFFCFF